MMPADQNSPQTVTHCGCIGFSMTMQMPDCFKTLAAARIEFCMARSFSKIRIDIYGCSRSLSATAEMFLVERNGRVGTSSNIPVL